MLAKGDPSQPKPDILEIGIQVNLLVAFPKIKMTLRLSVGIVEVIMYKYWHIKKKFIFLFSMFITSILDGWQGKYRNMIVEQRM